MPIKDKNLGKYKLPSCDAPYSRYSVPQRKRMVPGLGYVLTPPTPVYNQDSKEEKERKEKLLKKIEGYKGRKAKLEKLEKLFKDEL